MLLPISDAESFASRLLSLCVLSLSAACGQIHVGLGFPLAAKGGAAELGAVSAEAVRAGFEACLRGRPTLSLVGDEEAVRTAVREGWR